MKKIVSILLILAINITFASCEQARTIIVKYSCELTHFYSRHIADLNIVKNYITDRGAYAVGSTFIISQSGKNDEACYEEADKQAKVDFDYYTGFFRDSELKELLGEETEFEYSYCRVNNNDTIIAASYRYNMD